MRKINSKSKYIIFLSLLLIVISFFGPQAYARNIFKDFWRGLKKGTKFIVTLPDKATRWMGPVLGPIAADVLTYNIGRNPRMGNIFNHARKINQTISSVDDQKKYLSQVKTNLREQAQQLKNQAEEIRSLRNDLNSQLAGGEITFDEYADKVVSLNDMADTYDRVADRFNQRADSINPGNIIKMLARNTWREMIRQIKNEINFEVKNELNKFLNPNIINSLIGNEDVSFDQLLDILISGDISGIIGGNSKVDINELRERVRNNIKGILKNNKDAFKNNWRGEVDKIIKQELDKLEKEKKDLPTINKEEDQKDEGTSSTVPSDSRCPPGYEFCANCGVECRQIDCNDIPNAHWDYVSRCVCGSSGSIAENPQDPNKECAYSADYKSCPGCIYECVHLDEDCSLEGIGGN